MKKYKHNFRLESIPWVLLRDILNNLFAKACLDASFMCLSTFVAFCFTYNDLCC